MLGKEPTYTPSATLAQPPWSCDIGHVTHVTYVPTVAAFPLTQERSLIGWTSDVKLVHDGMLLNKEDKQQYESDKARQSSIWGHVLKAGGTSHLVTSEGRMFARCIVIHFRCATKNQPSLSSNLLRLLSTNSS